MSESVMVIVSDLDDAKRGEINVVEGPQKAARLVETLLEAGFDQARIRVFSGAQMDMRVRQRPVVALVAGDEAEPDSIEDEATAESEQRPVASGAKADVLREVIATEPYQRNGQKFSAAFRPA